MASVQNVVTSTFIDDVEACSGLFVEVVRCLLANMGNCVIPDSCGTKFMESLNATFLTHHDICVPRYIVGGLQQQPISIRTKLSVLGTTK